MKLNAKQLRVTKPGRENWSQIKRQPIYIVLDSVMDTYNIGSIFRLADAVAAQELILCGKTETPPSSRIHKAAVGTEEWVKWRYFPNVNAAITSLKAEVPGLKVLIVEQNAQAVGLDKLQTQLPVALIVGHETEGVSPEALQVADEIVEIPMYGVNKSLNVVVSTGIVLYRLV